MTVARPKVSVLLVDDDTDLLDSLEILVEASEHLDLAGRATNTAHAIGHCRRHQPDVVLADIRMPGADGLSLTRTLTGGSRRGRPRVLVTTAFPLDEYLLAALGGGASGFLAKGAPWAEIEQALVTIGQGGIAVPTALSARLVDLMLPGRPTLPALTPRELQILALVGAGDTQDEISAKLTISDSTVRAHLEHLRNKLGVRSRTELTIAAREVGLGCASTAEADAAP
jgi:DNA-binding NarL/FixJ family response regulator